MSWEKEKIKMSLKILEIRKYFKNTYELRTEHFCYDFYSSLSNKITTLENLNFDLEMSWKNVSKSQLVQLQLSFFVIILMIINSAMIL